VRAAAKSSPPPARPRVLVVGADPRPLPTPDGYQGEIQYCDDPRAGDLASLGHDDIVIVRSGAQPDAIVAALPASEPGKRPRIVVAGELPEDTFRALIERHELSHVMTWQGEAGERDLRVTLAKLLTKDFFGIQHYFTDAADGGNPARFQVSSATQRDELLDWVRDYAAECRVRSRLLDVLLVATDEMITNALYNAPTDGQGNHPYAQLSRAVPVTLDASTHVEIELRCDGQRLGISTRDPFGSLKPAVVHASLRRCFDKPEPRPGSTGGAGLGLYLLLGSLSQLVFNVAPGRRTEVIGLLELRSQTRTQAPGKSFNLFVER
jgi:hypothetical protein